MYENIRLDEVYVQFSWIWDVCVAWRMTTWRPSFEERDCPCIEWRVLTLLLITRMIILKFGEQCKYWWVVMLSFRHMHNIGDHWYDCMFYTCAHFYKIQIIFVYWLACFHRLVFSSELSGYQAKFEKAMSWTKHTYVVSSTCINQAHCIINIWWFTHFKPYSWIWSKCVVITAQHQMGSSRKQMHSIIIRFQRENFSEIGN